MQKKQLPMKNHEFNTIKVADGTEMELYTAFPEGSGKFPAIIVIQEAFGVTGHIRKIVEKFCNEGYAVVSPDIFHRTVHRLQASYDDFSAVMPHYQAITNETLSADLHASFNFLQAQNNVNIDKVGCIGFCLGGRVSFLANATLPLSAAISYYGGGLDQLAGEAPNLHGAHLFYWGGLDKHIPQDKIDTIINAVKEAGKDYANVTFSYADHAFNNDERPSYSPLAAKEAWAHTLTFFNNRLK
jgi:carboxymethylenebutenolidase